MASNKIKILIIGAGKAGELLAEDIKKKKQSPFTVVGFIDDDKSKAGGSIKGVPILGAISDISRAVEEHGIEEIFIAIPSERGKVIRDIIDSTVGLKLEYKILPRLSEVLLQDFKEDYLKYIRSVQVEDLLGGEILKSDQTDIESYVHGQTVLITGGAGSIGSELSRQIVAYGAKHVIIYDWWENGLFDIRNQIEESYPKAKVTYVIGDVKNRQKMNRVMGLYKPTAVFHAAAYKHVPLMEENSSEAVKNNMLGTQTVADIAINHKVKKFVLVSTDKAVNPTNVMGATKRGAEKILHILSRSQNHTTFCAVRFGNVINSNGSAIPIFLKQIDAGGPVKVTHKDITRYFMTIPEAVHLILQSWMMGENDDLFVLDMGEPVKIYDLAKTLITLHGYEPETEIPIEIIGLRPGEKLYEEVLVKQEETKSTSVKKIFRTKNYHDFDRLAFLYNYSLLLEFIEEDPLNVETLKERLKVMVPTYVPSKK